MNTKKLISFLMIFTLIATVFVGCGGKTTPETASVADSNTEGGSIYYLNFKPEIAEVYDEIAAAYEAETGIKVKVVTAAAGTYEQTLKAEINKKDAPTIFQINGPKGYAVWKDYTADLSDTQLYSILNDKDLAISDNTGVYGIPYVVEGYGIIYNDAIMRSYFALEGRADTGANTMEDVKSFDMLKAVVEDMTAHAEELEIEGVFASTSLMPGDEWRWHTHLANVPITYEFQDNNIDLASDATGEIEFKYSDNFKQIFDLYLNNSVTVPTLLGSMQTDDSMTEFALGDAVMVQNGNWAWNQIAGLDDNTVAEEDIKFLPIYIGAPGEETQGLAVGTENFFAINKLASETDQKLSADFLYWLYSSDTGKDFVTNKLNFIAPFTTFGETETPTDPLAREISRWMAKSDAKNLPWNFTVFPGQNFKDHFGADLLQYAQGQMEWSTVVENVIENWKVESAAEAA